VHDHAVDRDCVYCGADCDLPEPPHAPDCPMVTGLFTIEPDDLGHECVHCHERTPGMVCARCDHPFELGDTYCHQETDDPDIKVVVCMMCAVEAPRAESLP